ncbi:hypothetical protein [Lysinibacter sp. HNR]|uniref:hypothetical protein n=1 Tax=Lysinibacter sp. HNR TaxID=3031408 RepID=UPI002434DC17|nr:hypothetical protein [Lysinibacter sp. HNR]WGD38066.1 hypothetical protein FrondiHNR_03880 [Lysinibacter sp. HNR]
MSNTVISPQAATLLLNAKSFLSSTALRRGITLSALILILQLSVFLPFYTGHAIPPYDFLGAYAGDAFVWWTDGGFFERTEWVPYLWAGYPSAGGLQNSAWYLPTGLITAFGPYSMHMAAILAALHVAFGAYGMYFLLRALRSGFFVSLFASVALFFGVGFFSNASHIDIARAYAWLPWVLLVFTPLWKWKRWWSIPLSSLILWQALTGIYPGTTVAAVYALIPWTVVICLIYRPKIKSFILPLAVSGFAALLLSMPRLLPYALLNDDGSSAFGESSVFSPSVLGTVLFGYGVQNDIPNDVTMRSFFVPVTVLALTAFARWTDPLCKLGLAIGVPAFLLGMPFLPWFEATRNLPGLSLSRFTMSDFKLFLVLAAILLASSGLKTLTSSKQQPRLSRGILISLAASWLVVAGFGILAIRGPYSKLDTIPALLLLCLVLAIVTAFITFNHTLDHKKFGTTGQKSVTTLFSFAMIFLTGTSGILWAYSTPGPWKSDRVPTEIAAYGETVDNLISQRAENMSDRTQRPARTPLPPNFGDHDLYDNRGNAAFFSAEYSIAGYINLKRSNSHNTLEHALLKSEIREELAAFLALPGTVLAVADDGSTSAESLLACVLENDCGVDSTPISYAPGEYTYQLSLSSPRTVVLNESFFPGWSAQACFADGRCEILDPQLSPYGIIQIALPSGDFDLSLSYLPPGRTAGWILFGSGLMVLLGAVAVVMFIKRRQKETEL